MQLSQALEEQPIYPKLHCNSDTEAVCICSGSPASVAHFKVLFYAEKKKTLESFCPTLFPGGNVFLDHTHAFFVEEKTFHPPTPLSLSSAAGFSEFSAPPPPMSGGTQSNSVSTALKQLNICLESGPRTAFLLCCTIRTLNPSLPTFALHPSGPITSFFHLLVSPLYPPQDTLRCFLNSFPRHVHPSLHFILLLSPFQNLLLSLHVFS